MVLTIDEFAGVRRNLKNELGLTLKNAWIQTVKRRKEENFRGQEQPASKGGCHEWHGRF